MTLLELESGSKSEVCRELKRGGAVISSLALGPSKAGRIYLILRDQTKGNYNLIAWDLARGEASHTIGLDWRPGAQFFSSRDGTTVLGLLEGSRLMTWKPGRPTPLNITNPLPIENPVLAWKADGTGCYVMGRENYRTRVFFWDLAGAPVPVDFGPSQPDLMVPASNGNFFTFDSTGAIHQLEGNTARRVPGSIPPGVYSRALIGSDSRFPLVAISRRSTALQSTLLPPEPAQGRAMAREEQSRLADVIWLDDSHLITRESMGKDGFTRLTVLRCEGGGTAQARALTVLRQVLLKGRCLIAPGTTAGKVLVIQDKACLWLDTTGEVETGVRLDKMPRKIMALGDGFAGLHGDGSLVCLDGSLRTRWSLVVPGSWEGFGEMLGISVAPDSSSLAVLWRSPGKTTLSWISAADGKLLDTETHEDWVGVVDIAMVSPEDLALARTPGDVFLHSLSRRTTTAKVASIDRIPIYMDYSKAAGRMATIDPGGQVHLWDPSQWLHVPLASNPQDNRSCIPMGLTFSPGGEKLAYFTEDGTIKILMAPKPSVP